MSAPSSFYHIETELVDKSDRLLVRMEVRGKTPSGGLVINPCAAEADLQGQVLKVLSTGP